MFTFNVAPNPFDGEELNVIINAEKSREILVVIYDVFGQQQYSKVIITEQKGDVMYAIDLLQKLKPGFYIINATSSEKVLGKKLIVNLKYKN